MTTFKKTHKRKVKNLVKRQLPEFVLTDHPKFAEFVKSYLYFYTFYIKHTKLKMKLI